MDNNNKTMSRTEKAVLSAINGNKLLERQQRIASEMEHIISQGFSRSEKELTRSCNKILYDMAEARDISLWELCFSVVPRWVPVNNRIDTSDPQNLICNTDYELKMIPMEIDWERGHGYWEKKYRQLKSKIEKLINDNED